jgi:hypothetical protein
MNRNFAKPREDMTPEFAPDVLEINGRKVYGPKAVHCKIAGYLPLSPDWPIDPPEGKHYERTGKIEPNDGDGYKWVYVLVDNPPPPPRRWTRFAIKGALADARLLPAAKAFLGAYELKPDYTALEAFTDVDYIEEFYGGEETWNALLDGAAVALGKTREEIDAFLDAIPTEG